MLPHASTVSRLPHLALIGLRLVLGGQDADPTFTESRLFDTPDTCPDCTWGNRERQTRDHFAALLAAHLDAMSATDAALAGLRFQP